MPRPYRFSHEETACVTVRCEGCGTRIPATRLYESRQHPTARRDGESAVPGRRGALLSYVCSKRCLILAGARKQAAGETVTELAQLQALYEGD